MQVQTFTSKVSVEALRQMDEHINQWLSKHNVVLARVTQTFGEDHSHEGHGPEPVLVTCLWFEPEKTPATSPQA
jgi:hypothetical protein